MFKTIPKLKFLGPVAMVFALGACAQTAPLQPPSSTGGIVQAEAAPSSFPLPHADVVGRVVGIEDITPRLQRSTPSGAGAAVGAVAGGVLGNQIGGGRGRTLATVMGVAGGAVVGNRIESGQTLPTQSPQSVFRISIQSHRGQMHVLDVPDTGDLRVGDQVRLTSDGFIWRV
ncbi:glycine zipper 2TM domain-containing protein [Diaphorobacter aerolatus]|uniref:Glycine zipper 2TM domain-containing protein n=1 Tax=Diaphorobacter aerolatus TaxID=1288495 RepID=A0A7H0GL50_9BURK|nr:glycine zipper 2TM domain-containing protein [Diaphorobacter aerolatus]QNP49016.1 glycine zipper 2TM domain-containing protein [Diaphorobacter aerolatus]